MSRGWQVQMLQVVAGVGAGAGAGAGTDLVVASAGRGSSRRVVALRAAPSSSAAPHRPVHCS
jgi:hypothetical protein